MKKGVKLLLISLTTAAVISLPLSIGITYANYKTAAQVTQQTGYQGKLDQVSIFLNANVWEVDSPVYYLYDVTNDNWLLPEKTINPTIDSVTFTLYVYALQSPVNNTTQIIFARMNPTGQHINAPGFYYNDSPQTCWNQTGNITYSSSVNYYCVTGWHNGVGTSNGQTNSGVSTNHLTTSAGNLVFG